MRRVFLRFLPIFLLALTVQILAPVGACLARAAIATDPLASAVLCQGAVADHVGDQQQNHHMRDGSCAVCAAAAPFAPAAPQVEVSALERPVDRVVWQAFRPDALTAKIASNTRARGPPVLS